MPNSWYYLTYGVAVLTFIYQKLLSKEMKISIGTIVLD